jgi:hypothetical protein
LVLEPGLASGLGWASALTLVLESGSVLVMVL